MIIMFKKKRHILTTLINSWYPKLPTNHIVISCCLVEKN